MTLQRGWPGRGPPAITARQSSPGNVDNMTKFFPTNRLAFLLIGCGLFGNAACFTSVARAATGPPLSEPAASQPAKAKPKLDQSGRKRTGKASIYAKMFNGRTMADGTRMDPRDDNAASKTLPLGTTAKVTNLKTGQSTVVTIQDRGPYVKGRIVDLSPSTAQQIGLTKKEGVAMVEVTPLEFPPASDQADAGRRK